MRDDFHIKLEERSSELEEWKEQIWGQVANLQGFTYNQSDDKWETIANIEEVLRELMKAIKDIHPNLWKRLNQLLEKLDGASSARQTEKKGYIPSGIRHEMEREFSKELKASGGEKTGEGGNPDIPSLSLTKQADSTDSKPPEPKDKIWDVVNKPRENDVKMNFRNGNVQFINKEHRTNLEELYEKLCRKRERKLISEFVEKIKVLIKTLNKGKYGDTMQLLIDSKEEYEDKLK